MGQPALARRQLAVFSPLPGRAMARAVWSSGSRARDAGEGLRALLRERHRADDVVLMDSGTSALRLALRIARAVCADARAPVALPAFTCFEVASAAVGEDARVLLYDLQPRTLAPELDSLERVLRAGARVVVVSPLFGVPVDWDALDARLAAHGAVAIEDAAQGHGAAWRGAPVGSHGPLSVVSFGRGKGWTGGSGGALLLRGAITATRAPAHLTAPYRATSTVRASRAMSAFAQWTLGRPSLYGVPAAIPALGLGRTIYRPPAAPRAMDTFAAALLLATVADADVEASHRRDAGAHWGAAFADLDTVGTIAIPDDAVAGYLRFPLRVRGDAPAFADQRAARRLGIAPTYPATLGELPALCGRLVSTGDEYRGARALLRELVTVPTHSLLTARDVAAITDLVRRAGGPTADLR